MIVIPVTGAAFSFETSLPVSLNNAYKSFLGNDGKIHRVPTAECIAYKAEVAMLAKSAANLVGWTFRPGMQLELIVHCYFPDKRRRDVSNRIKLIEDSMAEVLHFDDSWTTMQSVIARGYFDKNRPRGEVFLRDISEQDHA